LGLTSPPVFVGPKKCLNAFASSPQGVGPFEAGRQLAGGDAACSGQVFRRWKVEGLVMDGLMENQDLHGDDDDGMAWIFSMGDDVFTPVGEEFLDDLNMMGLKMLKGQTSHEILVEYWKLRDLIWLTCQADAGKDF
jgi:hypothetical protein